MHGIAKLIIQSIIEQYLILSGDLYLIIVFILDRSGLEEDNLIILIQVHLIQGKQELDSF